MGERALVALVALALAACSSSSTAAPPPPPITGTVAGRSFTAKSAFAYVNASDTGGLDFQTVFVHETDKDCSTFAENAQDPDGERLVSVGIAGASGSTIDLAKNASAHFEVKTAGKWTQTLVTQGKVTVVQAATQKVTDPKSPEPASRGKIHLEASAGSDSVQGDVDFVLCH